MGCPKEWCGKAANLFTAAGARGVSPYAASLLSECGHPVRVVCRRRNTAAPSGMPRIAKAGQTAAPPLHPPDSGAA